jgi:hypothetical protein
VRSVLRSFERFALERLYAKFQHMFCRVLLPLRRAVFSAFRRRLPQVQRPRPFTRAQRPTAFLMSFFSTLQPLSTRAFSGAGECYPVRLSLSNENFK